MLVLQNLPLFSLGALLPLPTLIYLCKSTSEARLPADILALLQSPPLPPPPPAPSTRPPLGRLPYTPVRGPEQGQVTAPPSWKAQVSLTADLPLCIQSPCNKQQAHLLQSWTLLAGVPLPIPPASSSLSPKCPPLRATKCQSLPYVPFPYPL